MSEKIQDANRRFQGIIIATLVIVTTLAAYWFGRPADGPGQPNRIPAALQSVLWPEPKPLPDFTLTDHMNRPLTRDAFLGQWTFLFFGYTSCPDVCPTTLAILQNVADQLEAATGALTPTGYVFVSVDPPRDTPERLAAYVRHFHPKFIGASGAENAIAALARELYILYERADSRSADDYDINHTASILLIDPQARLFGKFSPPHNPAEMVNQFNQLRAHYRSISGR